MPALVCDPPANTVEALLRIGAGADVAAWSWLVEREGPAMFRVAQRALGSAAAADDACQEAFLHLRRGAHRFRAPDDGDAEAAARAWLLRIAANAAAMHARGERRRAQRERRQQAAIEVHPPATDEVDALRSAIAELPDSQRQPLILHHLGGQDYAAIGAALGISPGAARVRAHRGLESLRTRLAQAGVLAAATGLLGQLNAAETAMPAAATARWTAILTSTSTPAATTAAIFGGISTMAKLTILGAALSAAALCTFTLAPVQAEERHGDKPKAEAPAPIEPKEMRNDPNVTSAVRARVAAVRLNSQDQQEFVMLSISKEDKVQEGQEFIIFRDNSFICKVRVEKILNDMAAARVVPSSWNTTGLTIQQGDQAANRR